MSRTVVLELDDADYEQLLLEAQAAGQKLEDMAAQRLRPASAATVPNMSLPTISPMLNGPNSDWEQIKRQTAQDLAARHGGTPEEHLARLDSRLGKPSEEVVASQYQAAQDLAARFFGTFHETVCR